MDVIAITDVIMATADPVVAVDAIITHGPEMASLAATVAQFSGLSSFYLF